MLYRLVPTLIDEGYVYIAESPLYEINCKEKTYFAYTELEKNGILKEIGDQKCSINRSKGLGENDPDMMWLTTMNPETRRLIKVEPEDVTKMETMFNLLLGNDDEGRKRHIARARQRVSRPAGPAIRHSAHQNGPRRATRGNRGKEEN